MGDGVITGLFTLGGAVIGALTVFFQGFWGHRNEARKIKQAQIQRRNEQKLELYGTVLTMIERFLNANASEEDAYRGRNDFTAFWSHNSGRYHLVGSDDTYRCIDAIYIWCLGDPNMCSREDMARVCITYGRLVGIMKNELGYSD